jgi:hypothetical protein
MAGRLKSLVRRFFGSPELGEMEKDAAGRSVLVGLSAEETCLVATVMSRYKAGKPCESDDMNRFEKVISKHVEADRKSVV